MSSSHTTNASAVVQEEVFKLEEQVAGMHLTVQGKELQCKESYFRGVRLFSTAVYCLWSAI